ncbi:MAG: hypothetical protein ACRDJN_23560 [Chloroflexota bacterium]
MGQDGEIYPREVLPEEAHEARNLITDLVERCRPDAKADVLTLHLEEHDRLYAEGAYGPAVGEGRKFIEQLLADIARWYTPLGEQSPQRPQEVREYLTRLRFFDVDECRRLVAGVYGYLSETGSHPGVTDAATARMARAIILNFGLYVLEKWQRLRETKHTDDQ